VVDVKSAIARLGLGAISPQSDAESQIEYLAWFRFPVTWTYVSGPVPEVESVAHKEVVPKSVLASPSLTLAPIVPAPLSRDPVVLDAAVPEDRMRPAGSTARWEMMVPKMTRPPARPVANLTAATAPALAAPALAAPAPKVAYVPNPVISAAAPVSVMAPIASVPSQFVTPSFTLHTPEDQFLARYWPQIVYVAIAIAAAGCLMWGLSGPSRAAGNATSPAVSTAIWSHQSVSPSGRSLTVYEPSRGQSDYRMEFSWVPDSAGVGWVFRTRDENNYYAARLSLQQRGADGVLVAEHFSVLGGAESAHSRKVIPLANAAGLVRVHMDATGPAFKLFVENNPADSWNDARLNTGALGFYDDGDRLPKVLALSFTLINNAVSRTSVVPLP
jgi:hypothetical protein